MANFVLIDIGIGIYFDDIIIAADSEEKYDEILQKVIDRARKFNVKFNRNKIQFKVAEVKYLGQIFSAQDQTLTILRQF